LKKLFFILLFSTFIYAQPKFTGISSQPGAFSRLGFGARGMGMGNAMSAITDGNLVSYYNPALAVFQEQSSFQTSYSILSLDRKLNFVNFTKRFDFYGDGEEEASLPPRSSSGISLGLINAGVSNIDGRDESGNPTGALSTTENQFFFAFANRFSERVAVGVAIKYYYYKLFEGFKSTGIGLDVGAIYKLNSQINISFVITDIESKYKWDSSEILVSEGSSYEDKFPVLKKIGVSYKNEQLHLIGGLEFENSNAGTNIIRAGAEVNVIDQLYLRGGIDQLNLSNSDFPIRPSLGLSFFKAFGGWLIGVDYAYVFEKYSPEDRHIIGVNVRF